MNGRKKNERENLEPQLAASMLYYDKTEFENFNKLWMTIENEPELAPSGHFSRFVNYLKEYIRSFDQYSPNKEDIITYMMQKNNSEPNRDTRIRFEEWIERVKLEDTPSTFNLGTELFYHYSWLCYMDTVKKTDKSDIPFKEKLLLTPTPINYTEDEGIFVSLADFNYVEMDTYGKGFSTGYHKMDAYVQPQKTNLMIIAGRPSDGKSTLMLAQALENAKNGIKSLFISLEMTKGQIYRRVMNWYKNREVSSSEYKEIEKEPEYIELSKNINFMINKSSNAATILDLMKESIRIHGTEAIYLDYLQLASYPHMGEWESLRALTTNLKRFATSNDVLMVACTQVSRDSVTYGITLDKMFGSASIEADADIVIAIQAMESNSITLAKYKEAKLTVLKNRDGMRDIDLLVNVDYACMKFNEK